MTSDPDDAELIRRSFGGDDDAFVEVVRRHENAVGAYLARRAGRELAADLLSEVWVTALAARATYDRSFPDARPWLFGVAHNTLRRHWRSQRAEDPGRVLGPPPGTARRCLHEARLALRSAPGVAALLTDRITVTEVN